MIAEPERDWLLAKDEELLAEFVACRSEDAFREILRRYGPLVLSVCRRGTSHTGDAEDAFQATFMVLSQSARKVKKGKSLAAWLYGVAYRVCNRLRRESSRRKAIPLMDAAVAYEDPLDELLALHDQRLTDEELARLPESLRTPLVLRYLVGKSNADVAEELGISISAVEGRLKRAKQQLRLRLIRQGVTLTAAVAILKETRVAAEQLPSELITETTVACCGPTPAITTGTPTETNLPNTLALEEINVMNTIFFSKAAAAVVAVCGITTVVLGTQLALSQDAANGPADLSLVATEKSSETAPADALFAVDLRKQEGKREAGIARGNYGGFGGEFGGGYGDMGGFGGEYGGKMGGYGGELAARGNDDPRQRADGGRGELKLSPRLATENRADFANAHFSVKPRTETERKIQESLSRPLRAPMEFVDEALKNVTSVLQEEYEIPIVLDTQALDDIGIGPDEPVTIHIRGIELRSALSLLLNPLDLTYIVRDEVLLITTPDEAEADLGTRVYPLNRLGFNHKEIEQLAKLIPGTVMPNSWEVNGGEGGIAQMGDNLVIRQNYHVHEQINELLWQLEQTRQEEKIISRQETQDQDPFAGF